MHRPKVLLTRRWPGDVEDNLSARYDLTVSAADRPLTRDELIEAMRRCDALCPTVSDRIDVAVIEAPGATARLIANYGAGTDHIDIAAAARSGISVTNTPDVLTEATAELAILLMLMVARRTAEGERELRRGDWTGWRPTHLLGSSLAGKTLGLIGFGRIAKATARLAQAMFQMKIAYYARHKDLSGELPDAFYHPELTALLAQADVVSLHCPGGTETHHLINAARLSQMRPSAVLINTARGSVVDEAALAHALAAGRIAGAGLDVFENEPCIASELLTCDRAVLLPHLGSATREARIAMGMRVAANLDAFFGGLIPPDLIHHGHALAQL